MDSSESASESSSVSESNEIFTAILEKSDDDMPTDPAAIQKLIDEEEAKQAAQNKELEVVSLRQRLHNLRLQNATLTKKLKDHRPRASHPVSNSSDSQERLTIADLRKKAKLSKKVEKQIRKWGLTASTSSSSEDSESMSATASSRKSKRGKSHTKEYKSGKEAKVTTRVVAPQLWPHSELSLTNVSSDIKYEELTTEQFVAGYTSILLNPVVPAAQTKSRTQHLMALMYLAQQYEWHAVLAFHGSVLLEIERGHLSWGDSFTHLETRTLSGHIKSRHTPSNISRENKDSLRLPTLFCRDYQVGKCQHSADHFGTIRGVRKWLKHICAACWIANKKQEFHQEKTVQCPQYNAPSMASANPSN
jgi:hypothetical protein